LPTSGTSPPKAIIRPPTGSPPRGPSLPIAPSSATALKLGSQPIPSNCNPNYIFDADGNKIFKPECFGIPFVDAGGAL
jgi:hypothetical protein